MARLRVEIPDRSMDSKVSDAIRPALTRIGLTSKSRAQQIVGEELKDRSGKLKSSFDFDIIKGDRTIELEIVSKGADPYALYQHEGTGIYGPKRRPIKPKRGKFLVWKDPDSGRLIFAREVRGVPPKKFLTKAVDFAIKRVLR